MSLLRLSRTRACNRDNSPSRYIDKCLIWALFVDWNITEDTVHLPFLCTYIRRTGRVSKCWLAVLCVTAGVRWSHHRFLCWIRSVFSRSGRVMSLAIGQCLLGAVSISCALCLYRCAWSFYCARRCRSIRRPSNICIATNITILPVVVKLWDNCFRHVKWFKAIYFNPMTYSKASSALKLIPSSMRLVRGRRTECAKNRSLWK